MNFYKENNIERRGARNAPLFAVFDTETTGLTIHHQGDIEKQPRAIEFAGIITDGSKVIKSLEFICDPGIAIDEIITKITGLTNADLKGKPSFGSFLPELKDFFSVADVVIAHNLSFDTDILTYDLKRIGKILSDIDYPAQKCCTVEQTIPFYGRRMKLEQLYNLHVGHYEQKHRAMDDIMMLHEVCKSIGVYAAYTGGM